MEIDKKLHNKWIELLKSDWALKRILALKKDRSIHLSIDHRKLKAVSVKGSYPMEQADEYLN